MYLHSGMTLDFFSPYEKSSSSRGFYCLPFVNSLKLLPEKGTNNIFTLNSQTWNQSNMVKPNAPDDPSFIIFTNIHICFEPQKMAQKCVVHLNQNIDSMASFKMSQTWPSAWQSSPGSSCCLWLSPRRRWVVQGIHTNDQTIHTSSCVRQARMPRHHLEDHKSWNNQWFCGGEIRSYGSGDHIYAGEDFLS